MKAKPVPPISGYSLVNMSRFRVGVAFARIIGLCLCLLAFNSWSQADLPTVSITGEKQTITEGSDPTAVMSVTRTGDASQALEVKYVVSGSARNGFDYQRLSGSVIIPAGEYSVPLAVNAINDKEIEDPESLQIKLITTTSPFQLVILPDTQHYSDGDPYGSPAMFTSQTQWIVDNKAQANIAFVLHEGDCTENNIESEWKRVVTSMSLLDGVVPYAVAVGNHDGIWNETNNTMWFNKYFPVSKYQNLPTFGGVYQTGIMDNSYHLFSAGGIDWLVLSLEWGPRNAVLDWANAVVSSYPDRRVIYLSHTHVYCDNTLHGSKASHGVKPTDYHRDNNGTHVWDKLVRKHANSALFFNGHVFENGNGQGRVVGVGDSGNRVYQMLCNYQNSVEGGSGFLRYVTFYPDEDRFEAKSYSPYVDRYVTDDKNQFEYRNLGIFTNVSPSYLVNSNNSSFTLKIASDEVDTNPPFIKSVAASGNPAEIEILFNEPLDQESAENIANYSINSPVPIVDASLASDMKSVLLTCKTSLVPMSTYSLTVTGIKDSTWQSNQITTPVSQSFLYFPVLLTEKFSDTNLQDWTVIDEGLVDFPSLWFVLNGRLSQFGNIASPVGTLTTNTSRAGTFACLNKPLSFRWRNYAVSATLSFADNNKWVNLYGAKRNGIGLMFRYQNVSNYYKLDIDTEHRCRRLTKKVDGIESQLGYETGTFPTNADVNVRITAYGNQLAVSMDGVPLFGGAITDASLARGTVAMFCYESGVATFDNIVVTTQNPPPEVAITSPENGSNLLFGDPVTVNIAAADVNGLAKVELFNGNTLLKTFTNAPYTFTWKNVLPGSYNLTARATDIFDAGSVSSNVTVTIQITPPTFISQPRSQTAQAGNGVAFNAKVSSFFPLRYQWFFNGNPIAGATTQSLIINSVQPENAGDYALQVMSGSLPITSQSAALSIAAPISLPPSNTLPALTVEDVDSGAPSLLSIYGPAGVVQIQVSSDLQTWTPLVTLTNDAGRFFFTDPETNSARRFYRAQPLAQ